MGVASPSLVWLGREADRLLPNCTFSGTLVSGSFGYHMPSNEMGGDYSKNLPLDRTPGNASASSAVDLSFGDAQQTIYTKKLLATAKARDPRLYPIREFCGSINGRVTGFDLSTGGEFHNWDNSHLWHIHISFYRKYNVSQAAAASVLSVLTGGAAPAPQPAPSDTDEWLWIKRLIDKGEPKTSYLAVELKALDKTELINIVKGM